MRRDTRARTVTGRRPVGRLQGQARWPFVCRPQARRPQAEVIDVELLVVWARREQRAGEIVDGPVGLEAAEAAAAGMARRRVSTCGCAAVERVLELGADIRAGVPGGASGPGCSGDAEKVWAAVVGLAGECSRLARMHGRLGSRPDWVPRGARRVPVWERGAVKVVRYDRHRNRIAPWCALGWAVPREYVEARRESWRVWRAGLALLRQTLNRDGGLRGYGARWRKLRRLVLARDPICRAPGCNQASTEADHIKPRREGGSDGLDNLQGLCKPCHSSKTAIEDGRWGARPPAQSAVAVRG